MNDDYGVLYTCMSTLPGYQKGFNSKWRFERIPPPPSRSNRPGLGATILAYTPSDKRVQWCVVRSAEVCITSEAGGLGLPIGLALRHWNYLVLL